MHPFDEEDDYPAGRPVQAPRPATGPTDRPADQGPAPSFPRAGEAAAPAAGIADEPREDEGPGRPRQVPRQARPLTEDDWKHIRAQEAREAEAEARRVEELLLAETAVIRLPAFLAHPLVASALLGLAALLGLFVFSQVTSALAALATLPPWMRYLGWVGLTLLAGAVLYAAARFLVSYLRLRPNQPVPVQALQQLAQRTRLRWLAYEKTREARERLANYLRAYPLATTGDRKTLAVLGLDEDKVRQLEKAREELLDPNLFAASAGWFADFRARFQAPLDAAAEQRISYFARRVAVMTAASPNALIDTLLTGYCSFSLLADLCRIYNLRTSRLGTAVLLARLFFNAYLAGQLNELEGLTETGIQGLVSESGLHLGSLAGDALTAKVAGKLGARVASGTLNYFLLQRLGRHAARLLRPMHPGA